MEWRWFLKILTITIDGMVPAQPLAAMVFQWFFQFWGPMVHDGYAFFTKNEIRDKMRVNKYVKNLGKGSKTPGTETFRWGGTPPAPGDSTDEIFPKS